VSSAQRNATGVASPPGTLWREPARIWDMSLSNDCPPVRAVRDVTPYTNPATPVGEVSSRPASSAAGGSPAPPRPAPDQLYIQLLCPFVYPADHMSWAAATAALASTSSGHDHVSVTDLPYVTAPLSRSVSMLYVFGRQAMGAVRMWRGGPPPPQASLMEHTYSADGGVIFVTLGCSRCPAMFGQHDSVTEHMVQAHGVDRRLAGHFLCGSCPSTSSNSMLALGHAVEHHGVDADGLSTLQLSPPTHGGLMERVRAPAPFFLPPPTVAVSLIQLLPPFFVSASGTFHSGHRNTVRATLALLPSTPLMPGDAPFFGASLVSEGIHVAPRPGSTGPVRYLCRLRRARVTQAAVPPGVPRSRNRAGETIAYAVGCTACAFSSFGPDLTNAAFKHYSSCPHMPPGTWFMYQC